jgi:hypothetical protein
VNETASTAGRMAMEGQGAYNQNSGLQGLAASGRAAAGAGCPCR